MNNAGFYKRLLSYIVDISLISVITTLVYVGINKVFDFDTTYTDKLSAETTQLLKSYQKEEITSKEYALKSSEATEKYIYKVTLETVPYYLVVIIVTVLYGALACFYMKGRTLGKKFFKIQIVNAVTDKEVGFNTLLLRSTIVYNLYSPVAMVILVFIAKGILYDVNLLCSIITMSLTLISGIMILFNKEKRAVHDYICNTKVVSEI